MKYRTVVALAGSLAMFSAGAVLAHHSFTGQYDVTRNVSRTGVVTSVQWVNPHIYFNVDVTENGQVKTYRVESVPVAVARKAGLTKAMIMADGKPVTVSGWPGRGDPLLIFGKSITYADGTVITVLNDKDLPK